MVKEMPIEPGTLLNIMKRFPNLVNLELACELEQHQPASRALTIALEDSLALKAHLMDGYEHGDVLVDPEYGGMLPFRGLLDVAMGLPKGLQRLTVHRLPWAFFDVDTPNISVFKNITHLDLTLKANNLVEIPPDDFTRARKSRLKVVFEASER